MDSDNTPTCVMVWAESVQDEDGDEVRDWYVIDSSFVLDWVRDNFTPDEIFSSKELEQWAKDNGYN